MQLILTKSLWRMTGPFDVQIKRVAKAKYNAVEALPPPPNKREHFQNLLDENNLGYIAQVITFGNNVETHLKNFTSQFKVACELNPILINVQAARDCMTWDEQVECIGAILDAGKEAGVTVAIETHRGRPTFTPWTTVALLEEFPKLKLTADISHWYCVCESMLADHKANVNMAMERSIHIHGRVGHPEGPQVSDPRAPGFTQVVKSHEKFWDVAIDTALRDGRGKFTFTPEFGPPDYMPTLPYTRQPLSDLFDVCLWMGQRFRVRFDERVSQD